VASLFAEIDNAHPPALPVPEPPSSPAPTRATPAGQEDPASPARGGGAEADDRDSSHMPEVGLRIVPAVPEEHEVKSMQPAVDSEDYTAGVGPPRPPGQREAPQQSAAGSEALERARRSLRTTTLH